MAKNKAPKEPVEDIDAKSAAKGMDVKIEEEKDNA